VFHYLKILRCEALRFRSIADIYYLHVEES